MSDSKRRELAETDKLLPEMAFATRPLFGVSGVLVQVLDASKSPYEHVFEGRVNPRQAAGVAHGLEFMVRLQGAEPEHQLLEPTAIGEAERERVAYLARFLRDCASAADRNPAFAIAFGAVSGSALLLEVADVLEGKR